MPRRHRVQQGECLASIAAAHGFFLKTVWEHPDNAPLRAKRKSPYVLLPGDEVVVPDREQRSETCGTTKRHRFRRRGVPEHFRLVLKVDGEPRKDLPYVITIDGDRREGRTNGGGELHEWIPPDAREATLSIPRPGTEPAQYGDLERWATAPVRIGRLDPADTDSGVRARLFHLHYIEDRDAGERALRLGLAAFQHASGLPLTGELDAATADALRAAHGS